MEVISFLLQHSLLTNQSFFQGSRQIRLKLKRKKGIISVELVQHVCHTPLSLAIFFYPEWLKPAKGYAKYYSIQYFCIFKQPLR